MNEYESLRWVLERFKEEIRPFRNATNYMCWGCDAVFTPSHPKWKECPTDRIFPHEKDCKYIEVVRAANMLDD